MYVWKESKVVYFYIWMNVVGRINVCKERKVVKMNVNNLRHGTFYTFTALDHILIDRTPESLNSPPPPSNSPQLQYFNLFFSSLTHFPILLLF